MRADLKEDGNFFAFEERRDRFMEAYRFPHIAIPILSVESLSGLFGGVNGGDETNL